MNAVEAAGAGKPRVRVENPATHPHTGEAVDSVALLTLDRPEVLNALDAQTMLELVEALERLDGDEACRCVVITGAGDRAFAAGADIKEMVDATPASLTAANSFARWGRIRRVRVPIVAAVRGFALGGGCELAMACDMIIAGDDAVFGQPEIKIGVIPGAGGTQRLTRALGKAKAMEMILTGRTMTAKEAEAHGLVARVVAREETLGAALALAAEIAAMPPLAVRAAKEAVNRAFELSLEAGLEFERRNFFLLFASDDQKEGMRAFIEKRRPEWKAAEPMPAIRTETADGILTITLDRPDALNAFDIAMKEELLVALKAAARDKAVRVLIITGEGRAFNAGQDLKERQAPGAADLATELRTRYNPIFLAMRALEKPIIAAVNGVAAGAGCSLALACDLVIASESARFVQAFTKVGLVPDTGSTWFLPRLMGYQRAAEMTFLADGMDAATAERLGLVNRVVPAEQLMDEARALALRLAGAAPLALALTKRALNRALESDLASQLDYEAQLQAIAGRSADHVEGIAAFVEKRAPRFTGE